MRDINRLLSDGLMASSFLSVTSIGTIAQDQGRMTIQATAMGTSTQQGKMFNVNLHIEQLSTPDDRKALMDAFARRGQDGLVDTLEHMKGKGRISTPWGVGK